MDQDKNTPDQTANKSKAEGERWNSESDTVEQRDRSRSTDERMKDQGQDEAGGITNRPLDEEIRNQEEVPERGESRDGVNAGRGTPRNENE